MSVQLIAPQLITITGGGWIIGISALVLGIILCIKGGCDIRTDCKELKPMDQSSKNSIKEQSNNRSMRAEDLNDVQTCTRENINPLKSKESSVQKNNSKTNNSGYVYR